MSILSGKCRGLTWSREGPKFNLHHLREISVVFNFSRLSRGGSQQILFLWSTVWNKIVVYDEQNILGQMLALKGSPFLGVLGAEGH